MTSSRSRATRAGSAGGREAAGSDACRRARSSSSASNVSRASVMAFSPLSTPHVRPPAAIFRSSTFSFSRARCSRMLAALEVTSRTTAISRGRQLLPRPQAEQLGVVGPQRSERGGEVVVGLVGCRRHLGGRVHGRDPGGQPLLTPGGPVGVVQAVPRDAVRPRQRLVGQVLDTPPEHQQCLGEHVLGGGRIGTAGQEAAYRLDQARRDLLEAIPSAFHGLHAVTCPPAPRIRRAPTSSRDLWRLSRDFCCLSRDFCSTRWPELPTRPPELSTQRPGYGERPQSRRTGAVRMVRGAGGAGLRSPCRPCHPTGRPSGRPSRACRQRRPRW